MNKSKNRLNCLVILLNLFFLYNSTFSEELTEERIWFENANYLFKTIKSELKDGKTIFSDTNKINIFNENLNIINNNLCKKVIDLYDKVIESDSELRISAINNKASIFKFINNLDSSISNFKLILNEDISNDEYIGLFNLFENPYADFKYYATKYLAEMYYQKQNYDSSLFYLNLHKKYPIRSFCLNCYSSIYNERNELNARIYQKLNLLDSAIKILIPNITNIGLSFKNELPQLLVDVLINKYSKEFLLNEYNKSINDFFNQIDFYNIDKDKNYYLIFLNYKVPIHKYDFYSLEKLSEYNIETQDYLINSFKKNFTESHFYKILTKLN